MNKVAKKAVENYQCPGCVCGGDTRCFISNGISLSCGKHVTGTIILGIGKLLLGMPAGFCRVGSNEKLTPEIYETYNSSDWKYNKFNIPVWKYLDKNRNTIVRGICPRTNFTFLHIFLENCIDKIDCLEVTKNDVKEMDS